MAVPSSRFSLALFVPFILDIAGFFVSIFVLFPTSNLFLLNVLALSLSLGGSCFLDWSGRIVIAVGSLCTLLCGLGGLGGLCTGCCTRSLCTIRAERACNFLQR